MILVDTNLLLYASVGGIPEHERAREWLDEQLSGSSRVGIPWHSLLGFVRIASNSRAFTRPLSVAAAWRLARGWLSAGNVWTPQPTERHADVLDSLFASASVGSRGVIDIHLAALAIEHGLTLCSNDNGFAQFPALRWMNPLAGERS
jgi:toxin-antitoxin system PIN domain toxin